MLYRLPTKSPRVYRGKYPDRIHNTSTGSLDIDGAKCMHIETNAGDRYTITYDLLDTDKISMTRSIVGPKDWRYFLRYNTPATELTQSRYDVWLAMVNTNRAIKAGKTSPAPVLGTDYDYAQWDGHKLLNGGKLPLWSGDGPPPVIGGVVAVGKGLFVTVERYDIQAGWLMIYGQRSDGRRGDLAGREILYHA